MLIYPWQQPQWRHLIAQYRQQRMPHAILLTGNPGLGKLTFAQYFAHYLLCKNPNEQPCGQCAACHLTSVGNHPDLLNIFPEETGKNIKIEQIRQLIATFQQTAQRVGYQIALIAPAEALNRAAANALLKILEEPPGQALFILVSDRPGTLPATVYSRCQRIQFHGSSSSADWLKQQLSNLGIEANADLLLKIAEYAPLLALKLAQNHYLSFRDQFLAHLLTIGQPGARLLLPVEQYLKEGLPILIGVWISLLADMLRLHLKAPQFLINQDRQKELQQLISRYPLPFLSSFLEKLYQARQSVLNTQIHLNETLLLESLLIQFELV